MIEAEHLKTYIDDLLSEIEADLAEVWESGSRDRLPGDLDRRLESIERVHGYSRPLIRRIDQPVHKSYVSPF